MTTTNNTALLHNKLVEGIRCFFAPIRSPKATLGLSGGIDSAVVLPLAIEAIGAENIRVLLMPSQFSTDHSVGDAVALAENLNVTYDVIKIESIYQSFIHSLAPLFDGMPVNTTEENLQARIRGTLLMALSNKFGHFLLNTSNKSELAVGYGTLYGDLCGSLSVLGDVYKTQVYELAHYINRDKEIIPLHTITKAPSAELRHEQKDSDSLPDYSILDPILIRLIEEKKSVNEIIAEGFTEKDVRHVEQLMGYNRFKVLQTPPIIQVTKNPLVMKEKCLQVNSQANL